MDMKPTIEIDHNKCDREGLCVRVCWEYVFEQVDSDSVPVITHPEMCILCGHCIAVCPEDAITIHEMDMANFRPHTAEMSIEPDNLLDFLRMRRSVRNYKKNRPVSKKMVEKLIRAARYAPTGGNVQSLKHIIVDSRETLDELTSHLINIFKKRADLCQDEEALGALDPIEANNLREFQPYFEVMLSEYEEGIDPFFYSAPMLIITHADLLDTLCPLEDATLATYQMMLMAHSLGLGTCFVSNFYENGDKSQAIREILAIPPESKILMAFVLGYPAIHFRTLIDRIEPEVRWLGQ